MDALTAGSPPDTEPAPTRSSAGGRDELRLWLRLLTCTSMIEGEIRRRLRERFGATLPRFDLLAQLDKAPDGLTLSEVSRRMMVSNGNVTGLVERLAESGHVERRRSPTDGRVQVIRLSARGRSAFDAMAAEHERWIAAMFAGLGPAGGRELMQLLGRAKRSVRAATGEERP